MSPITGMPRQLRAAAICGVETGTPGPVHEALDTGEQLDRQEPRNTAVSGNSGIQRGEGSGGSGASCRPRPPARPGKREQRARQTGHAQSPRSGPGSRFVLLLLRASPLCSADLQAGQTDQHEVTTGDDPALPHDDDAAPASAFNSRSDDAKAPCGKTRAPGQLGPRRPAASTRNRLDDEWLPPMMGSAIPLAHRRRQRRAAQRGAQRQRTDHRHGEHLRRGRR